MSKVQIEKHQPLRFIRALQSRSFALLWFGQTISSLGDGAFSAALAWEVLLQTGSATAMSIVVIARNIPLLVFLLIGGVAADRLPRRLVMLYSDIGRGIIVLLIAVLGWVHLLQLWHLVILSLLFGFVGSFFNPAYQALPAQLVEAADLPSANALKGLSRQANLLLGPLLGAGCVALAGPAFAFVFDSLTFFVSSLCLFAIRLPDFSAAAIPSSQEKPAKTTTLSPGLKRVRLSGAVPPRVASGQRSPALITPLHGLKKFMGDVHEGFAYIIGTPWLWASILLASIGNMGLGGPIIITLPKLVADTYGAGVWLFGVLATAGAIGSIAATLFIGQIGRLPRRGLIAYLALLMCSFALIAFGLPLPRTIMPVIAIGADLVFGLGIAAFQIIWETLMQEKVPSSKLGRVSSIDMLMSFGLLPVGYALTGILTDHIGPAWVFIMGGLLNLVVVSIALSMRDIRHLE